MLTFLDLSVIAIYGAVLMGVALYVSRAPADHEVNSKDYFLAGNSLKWWAVGASLIAANISAEQIIGQSGQGFVVGLAIAAYEWQAALVLIIVAKYFLPIFLEKKIYTMPQFLEQRFDKRVSLVLSFFWLIVYIFINLTSVLWLGSLAINALTGLDLFYGLVLLAIFSLAYSLSGGLKAVAMTDAVQVILLIFGGLAVSFIALNIISESNGVIEGMRVVMNEMPEKFDMVLSTDNPSYKDLPGVWILLGLGVWIGHFFYWGFNQYITQRALAAKDIKEAQKGVMFAAYLKLLMPIVIVLPGICAAILFPMLEKSDQAYPTMMSLLPNGLLGLTFAALIAAIVSSLASMSNSISTIFTMDIYKYFKNENVSQSNLIQVGRITVIVSVLIATLVAQPLLGSFESIFQYIQNFTGYFSPGIVVIFLVALFWKKATSMSVLIAALISLIASILISINFPELPFIHRMTIVFILSALGCIVTTYIQGYKDQIKAIDLSAVNFSTSKAFNLNTIIIIFALVCIYVAFA